MSQHELDEKKLKYPTPKRITAAASQWQSKERERYDEGVPSPSEVARRLAQMESNTLPAA